MIWDINLYSNREHMNTPFWPPLYIKDYCIDDIYVDT